jgi:hypothetical protein
LQADARRVEASPFPAAYARKRMRDQVAALAARGAPSVSRLIDADGDIEFVEASHHVPVMGRADASIASWQEPDAFLLTVFLNRDALIKALDGEISAESDDTNAMTHEQRQKATATIMADMLACDRELSELIWLAQAEGLPVEFRSDANPWRSCRYSLSPHRMSTDSTGNRASIEPPSAHVLDHGLEAGEECHRVHKVQCRDSTDARQTHLDQVEQSAAHRCIEVRQVAHRHVGHRVQRVSDPLKPAALIVRACAGRIDDRRRDHLAEVGNEAVSARDLIRDFGVGHLDIGHLDIGHHAS